MTSTQRVAQVNVVQQQNAAAFGVKLLYCALHDLLRCPFRKFHPAEIRMLRQNQRILSDDVL